MVGRSRCHPGPGPRPVARLPKPRGFDGFLAGTGQGQVSAARETSRRTAYANLRESTRLESSGRPREAVAVLRSAVAAAAEIAFECARGLHAAGALEPALVWFRRALGKGAASGYGRNKYEVLQGILFILAEQHRFAEATSELDRFDAAYPFQQVRPERAFIAWRVSAEPPRPLPGSSPRSGRRGSSPQTNRTFACICLSWRSG